MESPEAQAALLSAGCAACGIAEVPVIAEPQPGQAARAPMPTMPDFTLGGPPSTLGGGPSRPNPLHALPRPLLFPVSWHLLRRVFEERGAQWWVFTASRVQSTHGGRLTPQLLCLTGRTASWTRTA